jgi:hypothetical protein
MNPFEAFVKRQQPGAQFVLTAAMLRVSPREFDALATTWLEDGGPGFNVVGVPFRSVVDGDFFISRVKVIRTSAVL